MSILELVLIMKVIAKFIQNFHQSVVACLIKE